MPVTPLFAAIFAIFYVLLAMSVISSRVRKQVNLGSGGDSDLEVAIRIHGNFAEYVPLALIMMWFLEIILFDSTLAFYLGVVLLIGRVSHIVGMRYPQKLMVCRQLGMIATFGVLLVAAGRLLWHYLPGWAA